MIANFTQYRIGRDIYECWAVIDCTITSHNVVTEIANAATRAITGQSQPIVGMG